MSTWFRQELRALGWPNIRQTEASGSMRYMDSPIIPIVIDEIDAVLDLKKRFLDQGILVGAVRPPTVQTSRLRISLHSGVTQEHLVNVLKVLNQWKNR